MELPSALQTFSSLIVTHIFLWQNTLSYLKCGTDDALSDLSKLPWNNALTRPGPESLGHGLGGQKATKFARNVASAWVNSSLTREQTHRDENT